MEWIAKLLSLIMNLWMAFIGVWFATLLQIVIWYLAIAVIFVLPYCLIKWLLRIFGLQKFAECFTLFGKKATPYLLSFPLIGIPIFVSITAYFKDGIGAAVISFFGTIIIMAIMGFIILKQAATSLSRFRP